MRARRICGSLSLGTDLDQQRRGRLPQDLLNSSGQELAIVVRPSAVAKLGFWRRGRGRVYLESPLSARGGIPSQRRRASAADFDCQVANFSSGAASCRIPTSDNFTRQLEHIFPLSLFVLSCLRLWPLLCLSGSSLVTLTNALWFFSPLVFGTCWWH